MSTHRTLPNTPPTAPYLCLTLRENNRRGLGNTHQTKPDTAIQAKPALGTVTDENIVYVVQPVGTKTFPPAQSLGQCRTEANRCPAKARHRQLSSPQRIQFRLGCSSNIRTYRVCPFGVGRLSARWRKEKCRNLVGQTAAQRKHKSQYSNQEHTWIRHLPPPQNVGKVVSQTPPGAESRQGTPVRITVGNPSARPTSLGTPIAHF